MEIFLSRVRGIILNGKQEVATINQIVGDLSTLILPGGGVHQEENLIDALKREVLEEVSVTIDKPVLKAIRETSINGYFRCREYFFFANYLKGKLKKGYDPEREPDKQIIVSAQWTKINELVKNNIKPEFIPQIFKAKDLTYIIEPLTLLEYYRKYKEIPISEDANELVHVMLKPDAVERQLEDLIISDLLAEGGKLIFRKKIKLSIEQVKIIYSDFSFKSAEQQFFEFLTQSETLHLAFVGKPGLHDKYNSLKGSTKEKTGVRGKYISEIIQLTEAEYQTWLSGKHEKQSEINMEMFCKNLIHVAPDKLASKKDLENIFTKR